MMQPHPPEQTGSEQRIFSAPSFPEMYEQALVGPLFDPWVMPLLDDVHLDSGDRVLDVACGTGIVARRAQERLGATAIVVGVDLNAQMLAVARRAAPTIDWREGDASALPLRANEQFDVVLCQQGFQFFADRAAAARQMRGALAEGGRRGVSTWRPDEECSLLNQLRSVAERYLGPIMDRRHSLGDVAPLEGALREAGFSDITSKRHARVIRFDDGLVFVRLNTMALLGMSGVASGLADTERQRLAAAIVEESTDLVRRHMDDRGFAFELGTNVVLARA